jgi:capsular exopolysaccharide synthesis family protein
MGKMQEALRRAEEDRARRGAAAKTETRDAPRAGTGGSFGAGLATSVAISSGPRLTDVDQHLVALKDPQSELAEQYRTLRANLVSVSEGAPPQVFVVTSAVRGEGKSVTTVNLACSFAEEPGKRVVVVDADMRNPTLHKLLGIDNQRGLADYLSGGTMIEMVLQRSRLPNLWVVPAGRIPANSSELLGGRGMDDMLVRLRRDFDHVIVDTPPVVASVDAAVLAPRADASLLVVRMSSTPRASALRAVELLRKAGAKSVGTVLTAVTA